MNNQVYTGMENTVKWRDVIKDLPEFKYNVIVRYIILNDPTQQPFTDVGYYSTGWEPGWIMLHSKDDYQTYKCTFEDSGLKVVEWAPLPSKSTEYPSKYRATTFN